MLPAVASRQRLLTVSISFTILIANSQNFSFPQLTAVVKAKYLKEK